MLMMHALSSCMILCYFFNATIEKLRSTLQWHHNESDGFSNHRRHECLLNRLFRRRSKKKSKLRVTGLCQRNSPVTGEFPTQGPVTRKMFPFDDVYMILDNDVIHLLWPGLFRLCWKRDGVGGTKPISPFPIFSALSIHCLFIKYHVHIWQVSPQLSCGDTCLTWMWFKISKRQPGKKKNKKKN